MSKSFEPRRLFYQKGKAHSVGFKDRTQTIAQGMNIPVAILSTDTPTANTLLAVTPSNSTHIVSTMSTPQKLTYHPYGFTPTAALVPIAFNGELYDSSANGYLLGNGYRLFLPTLMRFVSPDSISPFKVLNSYAYCNGDPVNYADPSGHAPSSVTTLKKQALETISKINKNKKEISTYQTPRQKIESRIRKIDFDRETAASYNNASSLKEESKLLSQRKQLKNELRKLPARDTSGGLEKLQATQTTLIEELGTLMISMGLPANREGIAQLLAPAPKVIRNPTPLPSTNSWERPNRGKTPVRLRLNTNQLDVLY